MRHAHAHGHWTTNVLCPTSFLLPPPHSLTLFNSSVVFHSAFLVVYPTLDLPGRRRCDSLSPMPISSPPHYASVISSPVASSSTLSNTLQHSNASAYTLATIPRSGSSPPRSLSPVSVRSRDSDRSPLLPSDTSGSSYGATMPMSPNSNISSKRILLNAAIKMSVLFVVSTLVLGGTLWLALPPLEE